LTILLILLVGAMTWVTSESVLYKLNPRIALENQIQTLRPNLTLDTETFPISIVVQDAYMNNVNKPEYFTMLAVVNTLVNTPQGSEHYTHNIDYVLCTPEYFPEMDNSTFYSSGLNFYYCLKNQNLSIGGFYDASYTQYLELTVKACRNSTESKTICKPESEIREFFEEKTWYWSMYYQNSVFNTQNYDNPKKTYLVNMYKTLKYGTSKLFELFLKQQELASDDGVIMTQVNTRDIVTYDYSQYDFSDMDSSGTLCSIYLFSSSNRDIFHRNYTKIQEVLANVGGLAKALMIGFKIFCLIFSIVRKNEILINTYFDFDFSKHASYSDSNSFNDKSSMQNSKLPIRDSNDKVTNFNLDFDKTNKNNDNNSDTLQVNNFTKNLTIPKINNTSIAHFPLKFDYNKILTKRTQKEKLEFSFSEILQMYICRGCLNKEEKLKYNLYNKSEFMLNKILDLTYYVEKCVSP